MITIAQVTAHIRRRNRAGRRYDWLGFVENKELSPQVESLFRFENGHHVGFDWVNGNYKLTALVNEISAVIPFNQN